MVTFVHIYWRVYHLAIMKKILIIILLVLGMNSFAQHLDTKSNLRPLHSIGVNLFGDASAISGYYEKLFSIKDNFILSGKLGFGYNETFCIFESCKKETFLTIPHHITANIGKKQHFFEFGFGGTLLIGNETSSYIIYPTIGYRIVPLKTNRLNFRIFGQYPLLKSKPIEAPFVPIGISLGLSF